MIFEPIKLKFAGREYEIPPDRQMLAIAKVEDVFTLADVAKWARDGSAPLGKLSMAYGAILRHAGAQVTDQDVYAALFSTEESATTAAQTLAAILSLMVPPDIGKRAETEGASGKGAGAAKKSSRKPSA